MLGGPSIAGPLCSLACKPASEIGATLGRKHILISTHQYKPSLISISVPVDSALISPTSIWGLCHCDLDLFARVPGCQIVRETPVSEPAALMSHQQAQTVHVQDA